MNELFVGFIYPEPFADYELYLVNNSDQEYERVYRITGMFTSADDSLIQSSVARKELGRLGARSSLILERGPHYDLDFTIWYHFELLPAGQTAVTRLWFSFRALGVWGRQPHAVALPVLDRAGWVVPLRPLEDSPL